MEISPIDRAQLEHSRSLVQTFLAAVQAFRCSAKVMCPSGDHDLEFRLDKSDCCIQVRGQKSRLCRSNPLDLAPTGAIARLSGRSRVADVFSERVST